MAKILVIDDEKQICELLQKVLVHEGHEVLIAMDGEEGLPLFYVHHPNVVITDIVMPKKNGLEVISELLHGRENTAVIAMTELSLKSGELAGIKGFLLKPFNFTQLLRIVHEITEVQHS
jgi:DNA-binding response OmpR family regulator